MFVFLGSIHATVISTVGQPVSCSAAFSAHRLRLLSCQLWVSLQARWREQKSCLCWTAVLLPACSLALVSGPVISVSDLSRQPTRTPASQRRARLRRDRCQQPAAPPPLLTLVRADACYDGATYLKLSNMERRVISATHSQPPYRKRPKLHQRVRALMSDTEHPPEETVPVQEHYRLGRLPDWLTDMLTDSFIVSFEERGWKALMKRPYKRRPYSVVLWKNYLFLCMRCLFSWQHSFSNCTKATMEESDMVLSDYKASVPTTQEAGISLLGCSLLFSVYSHWRLLNHFQDKSNILILKLLQFPCGWGRAEPSYSLESHVLLTVPDMSRYCSVKLFYSAAARLTKCSQSHVKKQCIS